MENGHTYETTNLKTGEIYIGKSKKAPDASYLGSGVLLKESIKKYGADAFVKKIVDSGVPEEFLDDLEIMRISEAREKHGRWKVLNIADGGAGGDTLSHHPRKAEIYAEIGRKVSQTLKGHVPSQETRELWRKQRTGKSPSKETRDKLSESLKAKYQNEAHPSKGKKMDLSEAERKRRSEAAKSNGLGGSTYANLSPERQMEASRKLSKAGMGRKRSEETRNKISASLKARYAELKNINQKQQNT